MNELKTYIEIDASPEKVWKTITKFEDYPKWNKFLPKIWSYDRSKPMKGQGFWEKVYIQKGLYMPLPMKFINWEENSELSFWGRAPWIISIFSFGYHIFTIDDLGEGKSKFSHRYINAGLVMDIAFMFKFVREDIHRIQSEMNRDLKKLCESE